jgi:hypothetical protein
MAKFAAYNLGLGFRTGLQDTALQGIDAQLSNMPIGNAGDAGATYVIFGQGTSVDESLLTIEERDYVYDYYRQWLAPCLTLAGYPIHGAPPRSKFIADWLKPGWWSPYDSIDPVPGAADLARLKKKCSPLPPALQYRLAGQSVSR